MLQGVVDTYIGSLSSGEHNGKNHNTIVAYRNDLYQICLYLEQQGVDDWPQVTHEHVAGYLLKMQKDQVYRPTTIARKLAALKSFVRYLRSREIIALDPTEKLEPPHVQRELPQILSVEQMNSLLSQVEVETPGGRRDLAVLHLLCATGMRVTELVSLNLDDIDVVQSTVLCPGGNGRNRRERLLPLPPLAAEATRQYIETARPHLALHHPEEQALFLNHHGERLTRQGFWLIIKGYARQAGIGVITPHMLRNSFAILMLKGGMELRSVQELLGHANIATTQVYSQLAHVEVAVTG